MKVADQAYNLASHLPHDERYGLTSQLKRSALSVPSNIAEGAGRETNKDFIRFLDIATGSLNELETQIQFAEMRFRESIPVEIYSWLLENTTILGKRIYAFRNTLSKTEN